MSTRGEIKLVIACGVLSTVLFGAALQLIFSPRKMVEEEKQYNSLYGLILGFFPPPMRVAIMMILGVIYIIIGSLLALVPLSYFEVIPSFNSAYEDQFILETNNLSSEEEAELQKYSDICDQIGGQLQDELQAKNVGYVFGYDSEEGVMFAIDRSTRDFTAYNVYEAVTEGETKEQIQTEIQSTFSTRIAKASNESTSTETRNFTNSVISSMFSDRFDLNLSTPETAQEAAVVENPEPITAVAATPVPVPPLSEADRMLGLASQFWSAGDQQSALQYAQHAYNIRLYHLGENHEKVLEVKSMLQQAGNQ